MTPYAHAHQRTSRLWHGDDLFRLVERVPEWSRPEPIPVGEARELLPPTLADELESANAAA